MHIRRLIAAAAAAAIVLPASGVIAAEGDCHDLFPDDDERIVLACEDQKFLTGLAGELGNLQGIWLTDDAPTTGERYSGGNNLNLVPGATFSDESPTSPYTHTIRGSFTGVIDEVSSDLYLTNPADAALGAGPSLQLRLTIDDFVLYDNFDVAAADAHSASVTTVDTTMQIVHLHFTDIFDRMEALGLDTSADAEHSVVVQVGEAYYGDGNNVLHYDNAEAPSSVTINPDRTFANKIRL